MYNSFQVPFLKHKLENRFFLLIAPNPIFFLPSPFSSLLGSCLGLQFTFNSTPAPIARPVVKSTASAVVKPVFCSQRGHCGTGLAYCPLLSKPSPLTAAGTCSDKVVCNVICPKKSLYCSKWVHCGTGAAYCAQSDEPGTFELIWFSPN